MKDERLVSAMCFSVGNDGGRQFRPNGRNKLDCADVSVRRRRWCEKLPLPGECAAPWVFAPDTTWSFARGGSHIDGPRLAGDPLPAKPVIAISVDLSQPAGRVVPIFRL